MHIQFIQYNIDAMYDTYTVYTMQYRYIVRYMYDLCNTI